MSYFLSRSAQGALTLPGMYYTSPEVFLQEKEKIFSRRWLCVGRGSQIAQPGDYLLVETNGEQLIVVRQPDGSVRAHFNLCRHRGTCLVEESRGHFDGNRIRCPYHAWTYSTDGRLLAAPHMKEVQGFDSTGFPLHAAAAAEWQGFLLVSLDPDAPSPATILLPLEARFAARRMSDLQVGFLRDYTVEANWKLIFQNYSECYHCPSLHPLLNRLSPYRDSSNELEEGEVLGGPMRLADGVESMTIDGRVCGLPVGPENESRLVYYYTFFPATFFSLAPDYVLIHRLEPLAVDRTLISCQWLFDAAAMARDDFSPAPAVDFWDLTNSQDWHISELSQKGISSARYSPGPYSNLESMVAAFDAAYLSAMGV